MDLLKGGSSMLRASTSATLLLGLAAFAMGGCRGDRCFNTDLDCFLDHMVMVEPVEDGAQIELVRVDGSLLQITVPPPPCTGELCSGACVSTTIDEQNCGECGNACGDGQSCVNGECQCPGGAELCDGVCVDTTSDVQHCGACADSACNTGDLCIEGVCDTVACDMPLTDCSGACVNTTDNRSHCGECGNVCGVGEICLAGACQCDPSTLPYPCGCIDAAADPENCGGCGIVCDAAQACVAGICSPPPPAGATGPLAILNQPLPIAFGDPNELQPFELDWHDENGCRPAFCSRLSSENGISSREFACTRSRQDHIEGVRRTYLGFLALSRLDSAQFTIDVAPVSAPGCPADLVDRLAEGGGGLEITVGPAIAVGVTVSSPDSSSADPAAQCSSETDLCSCTLRACSDPDGHCWYEISGDRLDCGEGCDCSNVTNAAVNTCCPAP